ncbi:MAG: DapH/DapD/GlmU-related protein [Bacteroidia bacterium]
MKRNELLIFGKISTGLEIFEIVNTHFPDRFNQVNMTLFNETFISDNNLENKINQSDYIINYIIGFSDTKQRKKCAEAMSLYSNFIPVSIISPAAYIAKSAKIGDGCYIGANATISTNAVINDHCSINLNVTIGHDSELEENVVVLPGARISGNVKIGEGTLVGANAFIHQGVTVGKENLIDALTYVHDNLEDRMISSSRNTKTFKRVF